MAHPYESMMLFRMLSRKDTFSPPIFLSISPPASVKVLVNTKRCVHAALIAPIKMTLPTDTGLVDKNKAKNEIARKTQLNVKECSEFKASASKAFAVHSPPPHIRRTLVTPHTPLPSHFLLLAMTTFFFPTRRDVQT